MSLLDNESSVSLTSDAANEKIEKQNDTAEDESSCSATCSIQNPKIPHKGIGNDENNTSSSNQRIDSDLTETNVNDIIHVLALNPVSRNGAPTNNEVVKSASNLKWNKDEKIMTSHTKDGSGSLNQIADDKPNTQVTSCTKADDVIKTTHSHIGRKCSQGKIAADNDVTSVTKANICDMDETEAMNESGKQKSVQPQPVYSKKTTKRKRSQLTLKKCAKKKCDNPTAKVKNLNMLKSRCNNNDNKDYNGKLDKQNRPVDDSAVVVKADLTSGSMCRSSNKTITNATEHKDICYLQTREKNNRECKKGVNYFQNEENCDIVDSLVEDKVSEDTTYIDSDGTVELNADDNQDTILPKKRGRPKRVKTFDKSETSEVLKKKRGRPLQKGDFKCPKCDFMTTLRKNFAIHKRNCRPSLKCKYCDFTTRTMQTYMEHEAKHTKERPFKCDQCNYASRYKADLYHHRAKHLTEKIHKCPHCDFVTKWRRNIYHHLLRHTEDRPFSCDLCGFSFKRIQDLKYHLYRHNEKKPIFCEQCDFRCKTNYELKCHMLKHSDERKFACTHPGCTQRVKSKSDLTKHMKTHLKVKPHSCEICGKGFKTIACLNKHKQRHTELRPFSCDICQRKFKVKTSLRNHIKLHTGVKPFSCSVCGHRFSNKSNMNVHIKTHEVEDRPFRCPICPHGSKTKAHLLAHIGSMHGSSFAYFCELCKKPFKRYHQLDVHYTRMHTKKELDSLRSLSDFKLSIKQELDDEIKEETSFIDNLEITGTIKNEIDENEFNKMLSEGSGSTDNNDHDGHKGGVNKNTLQQQHPDSETDANRAILEIGQNARSTTNTLEESSDPQTCREIITNVKTSGSMVKSKNSPVNIMKDSERDNLINGQSTDDECLNKNDGQYVNADQDVLKNNEVDNGHNGTDGKMSGTSKSESLDSVNGIQSSETVSDTNVTDTKESNGESGTKAKTYEPYPSLFEHAPATLAMYDGFRLPLATKGFEFNLDKTGKKPRSWFMDPANIYNKDYRDHQMRYLDKQRRLYKDIKPKVSCLPKRRGRPPKRAYVDFVETSVKSEKQRKLNKSHLPNCVVSLEKMDLSQSRHSTTSTAPEESEKHERKNLSETLNNISSRNQSNLEHNNSAPEMKGDNVPVDETPLDRGTVKNKSIKKGCKKGNSETDSKRLKHIVKRKYIKTKTKSGTKNGTRTKTTGKNMKNINKGQKQKKTSPVKKKVLDKKTNKIKTVTTKLKMRKGQIKPKLKCKIIDVCLKKKRGRPSKKKENIAAEETTHTDFDIDTIKIEDTGIEYSGMSINDGTTQNPTNNVFAASGVQYVIVEPMTNTIDESSDPKQTVLVSSKPVFKGCKRRGKLPSIPNTELSKKSAAKIKTKTKDNKKTSQKLKVKIKPKDKEKPKRKYQKRKEKTETYDNAKSAKNNKLQCPKKTIDKLSAKSANKRKVGKGKTEIKGTIKKKTSGEEFVIEWNTQADVEESFNGNSMLESTGNTIVDMANLNASVIDIYIDSNTHNATIKQEIQGNDDAGYTFALVSDSSEIPSVSFAECAIVKSPEPKEVKYCDDITVMQQFHGSKIDIVTASDIADSDEVPNDNAGNLNAIKQDLLQSKSLNHLGIIIDESPATSSRNVQNSQQLIFSSVPKGHLQSGSNQKPHDVCVTNGEGNPGKNAVVCKDEPPMDVEYLKNLYRK